MEIIIGAGAVYLIYKLLDDRRRGSSVVYDMEDKVLVSNLRGKSQITINKENLMPYLEPSFNPRKFESSKMMEQRSKARLDSMKGGVMGEVWKDILVRNDLRGEVGGNTGIAGPLYYRWG